MELRPIFSALCQHATVPLLVLLQVAISLAILSNALFIADTRHALIARPSGIDAEADVFYLRIRNIRPIPFGERLVRYKRLQQALRTLPGVVAVASTNQMPMSSNGITTLLTNTRQEHAPRWHASAYYADRDLLPTLGLKLVQGRNFVEQDIIEVDPDQSDEDPKVMIITRALADQLYPQPGGALGQTLFIGSGVEATGFRIIGVVERLQSILSGAESDPEFSVIAPARLVTPSDMLVLRTAPGQRDQVLPRVIARLRELIGQAVAIQSWTVEQNRSEHYRRDRALALLLLGVSILLLLVTAGAIIGTSSLWVAQRRKQIGIRRALGARKIDIVRYFLLENLLIGSGGVLLGCLLAGGLNQVLMAQMGQPALPASWLAGTALGLWLLGPLAALPPALRAANIAPALATRSV